MNLVDMMNIIFVEFHVTRKKLHDSGEVLTDDNFSFFLHNFFNKLNYMISNSRKLIICWEGKKSLNWRRGIFPDYKRNRDGKKDEEEFKVLFNNLYKVKEGLEFYPVKQISHEMAEADDVIYALAAANTNDNILIISSDKDLTQILNYQDNVTVYDPIRRRIQKQNENILMEKAIIGDASDGIGGLYRVGPKTLEKMIDDSNKWNEIMTKSNNKEVYKRLLKIIDLRQFPNDIHKEIVDKEKELEYNEFNPDQVELYYWDNKLPDLISRWQDLKEDIRRML